MDLSKKKWLYVTGCSHTAGAEVITQGNGQLMNVYNLFGRKQTTQKRDIYIGQTIKIQTNTKKSLGMILLIGLKH